MSEVVRTITRDELGWPMGHANADTTQQYTDELKLDELADALVRAADNRCAQASPDLTTLEDELSDELEALRWRRREQSDAQACSRLSASFAAQHDTL